MDRRIAIALSCLALSACSSSTEYRVVGAGSLSGVSVSDGETSAFMTFSGIIVEPLYHDPGYDSACRLVEARAFAEKAFSGQAVSLDDAGGMRIGGESAEIALLRAGYAVPDLLAPRLAYREEFLAAASEARKASRGIWNPCPIVVSTKKTSSVTSLPTESGVVATTPAQTEIDTPVREKKTGLPDEKLEAIVTKPVERPADKSESATAPAASEVFSCDPARKTCKAMKSCAEAKYFLANCGVKGMDGDKDGVPCEALCK